MKAYTYALPMLWISLWAGWFKWSRLRNLLPIAGGWILVIGCVFQLHSSIKADRTSSSMEKLSEMVKSPSLKETIFITTNSGIDEMMLGSFLPLKWGNFGKPIHEKRFDGHLQSKVALLVDLAHIKCVSCLYSVPNKEIFETERYMIIVTDKILQDGYEPATGKIDLDTFFKHIAVFLR